MAIDKDPNNFYPCYCDTHKGKPINYDMAVKECGYQWEEQRVGDDSPKEEIKDRTEFTTVPHFKPFAELRKLKGLADPKPPPEKSAYDGCYYQVEPITVYPKLDPMFKDAMYNSHLKFLPKAEKIVLYVIEGNGHIREQRELQPKPKSFFKRMLDKTFSFLRKAQVDHHNKDLTHIQLSHSEVIARLRHLTARDDIPSSFRQEINEYCFGRRGIDGIQHILRYTQ